MFLDFTALMLAPMIADVSIDVDGTLFVQMAAFLFTLFMLHFLLFKPYLKTVDAREDSVGGSEEEAVEMEAQAEVLRGKYDKKIVKARRDAQEIRDSLRNQGLAEQQDIQAEINEELSAKLEEERQAIAERVEKARAEIEARADGLADAMVEKLVP
jgi:F-type H+-transporting ATPase subunit b